MKKGVHHAVVKRHGHTQPYDAKKVYASVYAAALNCHYGERRAEDIAKRVTKEVSSDIHQRSKKYKGVSSMEIRKLIVKHLNNKEVALMYKHHLDVC